MRVGVVRSDLSKIYLADVENRAQRCFSSEPQGQSRYFAKPALAALASVLGDFAFLTLLGTDAAATVDTTGGANILRVKDSASSAFVSITVTANAALPKATVVANLNTGFVTNGLQLSARLAGNQVAIDTTGSNKGPSAYVALDLNAASTLNAVLGFTAGATTGLSAAALAAAVYPTATTIDVSSPTLLALSTFADMTTAAQDALVEAVADLVAPSLVETGPVLLSYVYGNLSKLRSSAFQPGGDRIGLPQGAAVAVVENDGVTPFSV